MLVAAATALPYVLFAIPFYRYLFTQQESEGVLRWEAAHSILLVWSLVKAATWAGADLFFTKPLSTFIPVGFAYFFARFCLVIPAAAVGDFPDLRLAWERSRNNGWRLVAIRGLIWILGSVPAIAGAWALVLLGYQWPKALRISSFIAVTIVEVVGVATLTLCFQSLRTTTDAAQLAFAADEQPRDDLS